MKARVERGKHRDDTVDEEQLLKMNYGILYTMHTVYNIQNMHFLTYSYSKLFYYKVKASCQLTTGRERLPILEASLFISASMLMPISLARSQS